MGKENVVSSVYEDRRDDVQCIKGVMKKLGAVLPKEAKAIVGLAFRNGLIEDVHACKVCPVCNGSPEYSRITDDEMRAMMKSAVNAVYKLLWNRNCDPEAYRRSIEYGALLIFSYSAAKLVPRIHLDDARG